MTDLDEVGDEQQRDEDEDSEEEETYYDRCKTIFDGKLDWISRARKQESEVTDSDSKEEIRELLQEVGPDGDTILHCFVKFAGDNKLKKPEDLEKFEPLLQLILEMNPKLLCTTNKESENPLFDAVKSGKSYLVEVCATHSKRLVPNYLVDFSVQISGWGANVILTLEICPADSKGRPSSFVKL